VVKAELVAEAGLPIEKLVEDYPIVTNVFISVEKFQSLINVRVNYMTENYVNEANKLYLQRFYYLEFKYLLNPPKRERW
jgi:hypothetical protein